MPSSTERGIGLDPRNLVLSRFDRHRVAVNAGAVGVEDAAATLQLELPAMPGAAEDRAFPLPVELARFESAMVPVTNPRQSGAPGGS